jgi:hypothetical protein
MAGQVPRAPTRPTRDILAIAADTLGVKLPISVMPACERDVAPFCRTGRDALPRDRPYYLGAGRFASTLWTDATSSETGVPETALSFRAALKRRR